MSTETPSAEEPSAVELHCTQCGCDIEFCSFCDRTDCAVACCYGCVVFALGEARPPLHIHGG